MAQDKLTKLAKGMPCQVRIPGVCNQNTATTVLAHYRLGGVSGASQKPASAIGAWACFDCHEAVDRRAYKQLDRDFVRLAHAEGVIRTLDALDAMGYELKLVGGGKLPKIVPRRCA